MPSSSVQWGLNETVMEVEASAIPTHGTNANSGGQPCRLDTQLRGRGPSLMCAGVQNDVLRVLPVPVFQFFTCLWRHVLGVLGVLRFYAPPPPP